MHLSEAEILLRANGCQVNPETQVITKFMRDPELILTKLEHQRVIDTTYAVPIRGEILDEKITKLNRTLDDVWAHDIVDLTLAEKVLKYVVVGLILLNTEIISHGDIKLRIIVQCGSSWKLTDFQYSRKIGDATCNADKYN